MISPTSLTASILIPVLVEPTLTLEQTRSVWLKALGIDLINNSSDVVMPLLTMALKPPIKLIPKVLAASSNVLAIFA